MGKHFWYSRYDRFCYVEFPRGEPIAIWRHEFDEFLESAFNALDLSWHDTVRKSGKEFLLVHWRNSYLTGWLSKESERRNREDVQIELMLLAPFEQAYRQKKFTTTISVERPTEKLAEVAYELLGPILMKTSKFRSEINKSPSGAQLLRIVRTPQQGFLDRLFDKTVEQSVLQCPESEIVAIEYEVHCVQISTVSDCTIIYDNGQCDRVRFEDDK
ncbi:MAG: hypothetical protein SGJ07_05500 [Rhodospirillaceae bacterium]|nr:hypothetical protein [Rhodospirillaceae bacterium]